MSMDQKIFLGDKYANEGRSFVVVGIVDELCSIWHERYVVGVSQDGVSTNGFLMSVGKPDSVAEYMGFVHEGFKTGQINLVELKYDDLVVNGSSLFSAYHKANKSAIDELTVGNNFSVPAIDNFQLTVQALGMKYGFGRIYIGTKDHMYDERFYEAHEMLSMKPQRCAPFQRWAAETVATCMQYIKSGGEAPLL